MVIVLALAVSTMAMVMLQRAAAERADVKRQLDQYQEHHLARGVHELVSAWYTSVSVQKLEDMLAADGHALDIQLADGTVARVTFRDGQGAVLADFTGLTQQDQRDAEGVLARLRAMNGARFDPSWVRRAGPVAISAASAPREVLAALASHFSGDDESARRFAELILAARREGAITMAQINQSLVDCGIREPKARAETSRLLKPGPELWEVGVEVRSSAGTPMARFAGLLPHSQRRGSSQDQQGTFASLGGFLTWERRPIEPARVGSGG